MKNTIIKHVTIWYDFIKLSIIKKMTYRANFILTIVDSLVWFAITISFFEIIYLHTNTINGWTQKEILILIAVSEFIKSMLFTFFVDGMARIPNYINKGELDALLLKPLNVRFMLSIREFDIGNFANTIPAIALFLYAVSDQNINLDFAKVVLFVVTLGISVFVCYSLWFSFICLSFWIKRDTEVNEMFLSVLTLMKYPREIYHGLVGILFTFVMPVVLASNVPTQIIISVMNVQLVLTLLLVALLIFIVSQLLWRLGLNSYDSASL